jgi:C-terminal processing protease CtpA/Prc
VSINGVNTRTLDLNTINAFFNRKPGKKVNLVVDRKGQQVRCSFDLEDQI